MNLIEYNLAQPRFEYWFIVGWKYDFVRAGDDCYNTKIMYHRVQTEDISKCVVIE